MSKWKVTYLMISGSTGRRERFDNVYFAPSAEDAVFQHEIWRKNYCKSYMETNQTSTSCEEKKNHDLGMF